MIEQIDERFAETYYAIREQAIREVIDWIDWLQSDESQREALGAAGNAAWYEFQDDPVGCLSHRVAYFARGEEDEMGGRIPAADLPPTLYAVLDEDGELLAHYGNPVLFKKLSLAEKCRDDAKKWNEEILTIVEYGPKGYVRPRKEKEHAD